MSDEYIVVTGGAGYIGSHTVVELINNGYKVIIVDNLVNSSFDAVARVEFIVKQQIPFYNIDIRDHAKLSEVFSKHKVSSVIHFAALKAVGESTKIPLDYYDNNVNGTINLLKVMKAHDVKTIVFSSSATVYGDATRFENMIPIPEHCPNDPTNPYGKTKYIIEQIIHDLYISDPTFKAAILRYFNPIGAHPSGLIGEDPLGIPNNLLPYLAQVAIGRREKLSVFGNDYNSHDGTPIRDYIHVVDLAKGHLSSLQYLQGVTQKGLFREWNLGTGKGSTVFDVYHAFCKAVGRELPYEVVGRRAGDVLDLTANPTRANTELKWKAKLTIEDACRDLWRWTTENPFGFKVSNYTWKQFGGQDYANRLHTVSIGSYNVSIMNHGATIQDISIDGNSLICGFEDFNSYKRADNPFFGATIGRYANRIGKGQFQINGQTFKLDLNENGTTSLHGGFNGFDKQTFVGPVAKQYKANGVSLEFLLVDKDGNGGFPGTLWTSVKFNIDLNLLECEFEAQLSPDSEHEYTAVNLTNHNYFNLGKGDTIDGTEVQLFSDKFVETDSNNLPTGNKKQLKSKHILLTEKVSFDDGFVVDEEGSETDTRDREYKKLALVKAPDGDYQLEVYSTDPFFQFYTGDGINVEGKFKPRAGLCIEPGRFTNAINFNDWKKQVVLSKGKAYGSKFKYVFSHN